MKFTSHLDTALWTGKRVLVTGHTGFKGSWLSLWLTQLGAEVSGLALAPSTDPALYSLIDLENLVDTHIVDVVDEAAVQAAITAIQPDVIFHLAAQVLVRESYVDPHRTFETNMMGTFNVLNAARTVPNLEAVVVITSDKCYENVEWVWAYRENEAMGGHDPYSASKGCAELITSSMRRSYFNDPDGPLLASVRAGNVIGGGDWSADRLIPDIIKAFGRGEEVVIRRPEAVRPWQHVLEPLSGYLTVAEHLVAREANIAEGWNFGPSDEDAQPVGWIVEEMAKRWGDGCSFKIERDDGPHEATLLKLDCAKAAAKLGWRPRVRLGTALEWVIDWYKAQQQGEEMRAITLAQIRAYEQLACG